MPGLVLAALIKWDVVFDNLFSELVLRAVLETLRLSIVAMILGLVIGTAFALMRQSSSRPVRWAAFGYIWFFRGTPLLVQVVFWFFALPQLWPQWAPWDGQLTALQAAILALAINEGAYMTEIIRSGIISVDSGQVEAARSLGMSYWLAMRSVVLPQAVRVAIPPTMNEFIGLLKSSSLVNIISIGELFFVARQQYSSTLNYLEWLIIISIWYLALTSLASMGQAWLELRFGTGGYGRRRERFSWRRIAGQLGGQAGAR